VKPHWMQDLIACSWWENDGPVLLRAKFAFDDTLNVPVPTTAPVHTVRPSRSHVRERVLSVLRRFPEQSFYTSTIADRLRLQRAACHDELQHLCAAGLVVRDGVRSAVGKYQLAPIAAGHRPLECGCDEPYVCTCEAKEAAE
jgi:hypothetical protein